MWIYRIRILKTQAVLLIQSNGCDYQDQEKELIRGEIKLNFSLYIMFY